MVSPLTEATCAHGTFLLARFSASVKEGQRAQVVGVDVAGRTRAKGGKPQKWAGREARQVLVSILTGKHDRQHANGLCGVARVFAPHVAPGAEACPVVIVDLPENLVAVMLE